MLPRGAVVGLVGGLLLAVGLLPAIHAAAQAPAGSDAPAASSGAATSTPTPTPTTRPMARYGPGWRPPEPEGPPIGARSVTPPQDRPPAGMPFNAPAAAAVPGTPGPRPDGQSPPAATAPPAETGGVTPTCDWHLAGSWSAAGAYTAGRLLGEAYAANVSIRQFGSHLVGAQADESITYYGRCTADALDLEVWTGWDFIGRQSGSVAPDGLSIVATWALWAPESMEGRETLSGRARRLR